MTRVLLSVVRPRIVEWRLNGESEQKLHQFCRANGIPRAEAIPFHMTIIYSKNGMPSPGLVKPFTAFPVSVAERATKYVKLGPKRDVLTIAIDSAAAQLRHRQFIQAGAISDYPKYIPHVSLTALHIPWKPPVTSLPPLGFQLVFNREVNAEHVKMREDKVDDDPTMSHNRTGE